MGGAHPDRDHMDRDGWAEANPSLGHPDGIQMETLEGFHDSFTLPMFQRECLCQWIDSSAPRLVTDLDWSMRLGQTGYPVNPSMGISVDPSGTRASAVIAWPMSPSARSACSGKSGPGSPATNRRTAESPSGLRRYAAETLWGTSGPRPAMASLSTSSGSSCDDTRIVSRCSACI